MKNNKLVCKFGMVMLSTMLLAGCGESSSNGDSGWGLSETGKTSVVSPNVQTPEFSAEKGIDINSMEGVAWQYGGYYERIGRDAVGDFIPEAYYLNNNGSATANEISRDDVNCILGITNEKDGSGNTAFARIYGSKSLLKADYVFNTEKGTQLRALCKRDRFNSNYGEESANDLYGIELVFIDGYNYSGVTKDSSVNEILNAGFVESPIYGEYFKIYSDAEVNMSKYDADFEAIYNADVSNAEANQHGYSMVDYGNELFSTRYIFADAMTANDKQRDFSVGPSADEYFKRFIENAQMDKMADKYNLDINYIVKQECAIAEQWHKLNMGEIEYFAIVGIETHSPEDDLFFSGGMDSREISFETNVCHVYLCAKKDTVLKWLSNWGF